MPRYFRDDASGRIFKADDTVPQRQIEAFKASLAPAVGQADSSAFPAAAPYETSLIRTPPWWLSALRRGNEALPSVLSTAASLPGVMSANLPLAALGTAMGPVAGVPLRDRIRPILGYHVPSLGVVGDATRSMRDVGGEIAANETALLAGEGLARGAGAVGQGMRWSALGPGKGMLKKVPEVKRAFWESRIPIRSGVGEGTAMAEGMKNASMASADALVVPHQFSLADIAGPLLKKSEELKGSALTDEEIGGIVTALRDDMNDLLSHAKTAGYLRAPKRLRPTPTKQLVLDAMGKARPEIPPAPVVYSGDEMLAIRRAADELSSGPRNATSAGTRNVYANPTRAVEVGDLARGRINLISGVAEQNQKTQVYKTLEEAVKGAEANAAKPSTNPGEITRFALGLGAGYGVQGDPLTHIAAGTLAYSLPKLMSRPAVRDAIGRALVSEPTRVSLRMVPRVIPVGRGLLADREEYQVLTPEEASRAARALRQHGIVKSTSSRP